MLFAGLPSTGALGAGARGTDMDLKAGYENRFLEQAPVPVSVVIRSSRAVKGRLSISSSRPAAPAAAAGTAGASSPVQTDVEVPAGGRKKLDFLVPGAESISASFNDMRGKRLASARTSIAPAREVLVGILGKAPPGLKAVGDAAGIPVRVVGVPASWLELGSPALTPLQFLVLDSSSARNVTGASARAIRQWMIQGGRAVLGEDSSASDLLKGAGAPRAAGGETPSRFPMGFGGLVVVPRSTASLADPAEWRRVIVPVGRFGRGPFQVDSSASQDLALGSAVVGRGPGGVGLGWLTGFLTVYVLAAGPVSYYVLKRAGRKELLWLTVPGFSFLFSVAGYLLARTDRQSLLRQATVAFAADAGSTGERTAVFSSDKEGEATVGLGTAFAGSLGAFRASGDPGGAVVSVRPPDGDHAARLVLRTAPFSPVLVKGSPAGVKGFIDGDLSWNGTVFAGTVTNRTPYRLSRVKVWFGSHEAALGPLAPGASVPVGPFANPSNSPFPGPQSSTSFNSYGYPNRRSSSPEEVERVLLDSFEEMFSAVPPLGFPYVSATTYDDRPPLRLNGRSVKAEGPTLIISKLDVHPAGPVRVPSEAGTLEPVQLDSARPVTSFPGTFAPRNQRPPLTLQGFQEALFVWRLPEGIPPDSINGAWLNLQLSGPVPTVPLPVPAPPGGAQGGSAVSGSAVVTASPVPVPGPGGFSPAKVEVYDWQSGSWVGFDAPPAPSSFPVPLSVLRDGEALIKVTPTGVADLELRSLGLEVQTR